jgi:hypothetical protein
MYMRQIGDPFAPDKPDSLERAIEHLTYVVVRDTVLLRKSARNQAWTERDLEIILDSLLEIANSLRGLQTPS